MVIVNHRVRNLVMSGRVKTPQVPVYPWDIWLRLDVCMNRSLVIENSLPLLVCQGNHLHELVVWYSFQCAWTHLSTPSLVRNHFVLGAACSLLATRDWHRACHTLFWVRWRHSPLARRRAADSRTLLFSFFRRSGLLKCRRVPIATDGLSCLSLSWRVLITGFWRPPIEACCYTTNGLAVRHCRLPCGQPTWGLRFSGW